VNKLAMKKRDNRKQGQSQSKAKCFRCGKGGHYRNDKSCPAWGTMCAKCDLPDHDSSVSRSEKSRYNVICKRNLQSQQRRNIQGKSKKSDSVVSEDSHEEKQYCFNAIYRAIDAKLTPVNVGGVEIHMLIDSGSTCNVM
jgi:hypothetical protein